MNGQDFKVVENIIARNYYEAVQLSLYTLTFTEKLYEPLFDKLNKNIKSLSKVMEHTPSPEPEYEELEKIDLSYAKNFVWVLQTGFNREIWNFPADRILYLVNDKPEHIVPTLKAHLYYVNYIYYDDRESEKIYPKLKFWIDSIKDQIDPFENTYFMYRVTSEDIIVQTRSLTLVMFEEELGITNGREIIISVNPVTLNYARIIAEKIRNWIMNVLSCDIIF